MLYHDWGFAASPFQTTSLPPSDLGERLLVGREKEIDELVRRIQAPPKLATLEGLNGVGKTSVVNVASYRLYRQHLERGDGALFLPCRKIFQLNPGQDLQSFVDQVLMEVAQTLIDGLATLEGREEVKTEPIRRWLNLPQLDSYQAGVWVIQGGKSSETNTSAGFERSGFRKAILSWLEAVFPPGDVGGVVCTIDNLELLQSSETARQLLEQLRDELFTVPGLRWVLCGALGIVYGVVSSPRLEGFLHKPIEVRGIDSRHAREILSSRINALSTPFAEAYLPLLPEDFGAIYDLLRGNLRSVLSHADDYCQWAADRTAPQDDASKHVMFLEWIQSQAQAAHDAVSSELRPKAWEVFDNAAALFDGIFSPSDFEWFGFNSIAAFRPHIKDLEAAGMLVSTKDDGDKRRKTIQITPKGWIINFHVKTQKVRDAETKQTQST